MNRLIAILATVFFIVCFGMHAPAQRQLPPDLIGVDLKEVQKDYLRKINNGVDSLLAPYAEALYYDGQLEKALEVYQRADSLDLPISKGQKRNFSFVARRLGVSSPYDVQTGYFAGFLDIDADIKPFVNNSEYEDFAPLSWQNLLFITSSRPESRRRKGNIYAFTRKPFLNVYAYTLEGQPVDPDFLPTNLNTDLHDGPIAIAADTSLVIITRNYENPNQDGVHSLYLAYYTSQDNEWSEEMSFPANNKEYFVQHPYYVDKTNTLYFSSNMPGGYGGFDLYKSQWDGDEWSEPTNLGEPVNSVYDEVFPSFCPDGNLIYATNHIETTGGLDLAMIKDGERYLFPEPFNTPYDDFAITYKNEYSGYFSTNRDFDDFGDNVYSFDIIPPPEYPFVVRVVDKDSQEVIPGAAVSYRATQPSLDDKEYTPPNGEVTIHQGPEEPFITQLNVLQDEYYPLEVASDNFYFQDQRWIKVVELEPIPQVIRDGSFVVYFDNDHPDPRSMSPETNLSYKETFEQYIKRKEVFKERSADSRQQIEALFEEVRDGMQQLEHLADFLQKEFEQGRHYTIEFTSHASPLASSEYNFILSQRRFASVENYIQDWDDGALQEFIDRGKLEYENNPFGDAQARPDVSSERDDPARSVYSVKAARERRVTIEWQRNDGSQTGSSDFREGLDSQEEQVFPDQERSFATEEVYHVIIASFAREQDALEKVRQLREQYPANVRVLPMSDNGRYRVSYGNYASMEDANAALQSIRRNIRDDAWILVLD